MSITEQKEQIRTELNSIEDAINDIRLGKVVVVVDDEKRFVTGQNQNSGLETSHKMMAVIAER